MDYWIHLKKKAVDVAEECLKRHGDVQNLEDPSKEVTMMFFKHYPDPSLSAVFKFKTADKWKASEIQECLNDHQTELKIQQQRARNVQVYRDMQLRICRLLHLMNQLCLGF